jgi:hypothetical protein
MTRRHSIQFCDSSSVLIINSTGIIRHLFTPFKVKCIEDVGRFKMGSFVFVEEVAAGDRDELIYLIGEGAYFHRNFRIIANF